MPYCQNCLLGRGAIAKFPCICHCLLNIHSAWKILLRKKRLVISWSYFLLQTAPFHRTFPKPILHLYLQCKIPLPSTCKTISLKILPSIAFPFIPSPLIFHSHLLFPSPSLPTPIHFTPSSTPTPFPYTPSSYIRIPFPYTPYSAITTPFPYTTSFSTFTHFPYPFFCHSHPLSLYFFFLSHHFSMPLHLPLSPPFPKPLLLPLPPPSPIPILPLLLLPFPSPLLSLEKERS